MLVSLTRPAAPLARMELHVLRTLLASGVVLMPAFWVLYRAVTPGAFDPLWMRITTAGLCLGLLAFSHRPAFVDGVRRLTATWLGTLLSAYMLWLALRNGLTGIWVAGTFSMLVIASSSLVLFVDSSKTALRTWAGLVASDVGLVTLHWTPEAGIVLAALLVGRTALVLGLVSRFVASDAVEQAQRHAMRQRSALVLEREGAEAAVEAHGAFLARMSHEIRTPLNGVLGSASLLLETPLTPEQQELAHTLRASGESLIALLNDVLDLSKIEAGHLELDPAPFDVRTLAEAALDLVAPIATEKGLQMAAVVAPDVPAALVGDAARLRQVLVNLLANAVRFTASGSVSLRIGVPRAGRLGVAVVDTGIGIPLDRQAAIFESFAQASGSTARQYGGTGLGLPISAHLVEAMGGRLQVDSQPGVGSTFHFVVDAPAAPAGLGPVPLGWGSPASVAGRRVLVLWSFPDGRQALAHAARAWNVAVEQIADPLALFRAVERAEAAGRPFDLLLLDLASPDGAEGSLVRALRARVPTAPPVVLLAAPHREVAVREALALPGVAGVLYKPVHTGALYALLSDVLGAPLDALHGPEEPAAALPPTRRSFPGLRVLVAEDNPNNQRIVHRMLERLGAESATVANGAEALQALDAAHRGGRGFDVVLMDVQMPVLDGLAATRALRASLPPDAQPFVVALTANAFAEDRRACLDAGVDAYLAKPVGVNDLADVLAQRPGHDAPVPVTA